MYLCNIGEGLVFRVVTGFFEFFGLKTYFRFTLNVTYRII